MDTVPEVLHPGRSASDTGTGCTVVNRRTSAISGMEGPTDEMHRADKEPAETLLFMPRSFIADKGRRGSGNFEATAGDSDKSHSEKAKSNDESSGEIDSSEKVTSIGASGGRHAVLSIWCNDEARVLHALRRGASVPNAVSVYAHKRHEVRPHAGSAKQSVNAVVQHRSSIQIRE